MSRNAALVNRNVYVASLPRAFTQRNLEELFEPYGPIESAVLAMESSRGVVRCKGYGFVLFKNPRSAERAIEVLDMTTIGGRVIQTRLSASRPPPKKLAAGRSDYAAYEPETPEIHHSTAAPECITAMPHLIRAFRYNPYSADHVKEEVPMGRANGDAGFKAPACVTPSSRSGYSSEGDSDRVA